MARNYYCEINLHVTWHAKLSRPLITPEVEPLVHKYVKKKAIDLGGIYIHESAAQRPMCTWPSRSSRQCRSRK